MDQEVPKDANEHCPGVSSEQAGKGSACAGCPNQAVCSSGQAKLQIDNEDITERMGQIKHKIFILSGKGGVGKSTVSAQLAHILSSRGFDVGLLDVDICGPSIPRMMGLEGREVHSSNQGWQPIYVNENLGVMSIGFMMNNKDDAVIWRGPRKNGLIRQFLTDVEWGTIDFLLIDTPPGTSDEHISIVQYLQSTPSDGAIIVTTPQVEKFSIVKEVALSDVRKEISFCQKTSTPIVGVVENMSGFVCPNCSHCSDIFPPVTGGAKAMCQTSNLKLLAAIPLEPKVLIATEKGKSVLDESKDSVAAREYNRIVDQLLEYCKEPLTNL